MKFHWVKLTHDIDIKTTLNTYAYLHGQKIERIVIAMHGYGDNAANAVQLAQEFHLDDTLFLFIEGPTKIPGIFGGHQWFDLFHNPHKKIEESAKIVLQLFTHLTDDHKIESEKIFFMGFSQGAAMALYCGLKTHKKIGGIISASGFMVHATHLLRDEDKLDKTCPLLLLHGDQDQVIFPILYFEAAAILEHLGFTNLTAKLYSLGHTITAEEIVEMRKFLLSSRA